MQVAFDGWVVFALASFPHVDGWEVYMPKYYDKCYHINVCSWLGTTIASIIDPVGCFQMLNNLKFMK